MCEFSMLSLSKEKVVKKNIVNIVSVVVGIQKDKKETIFGELRIALLLVAILLETRKYHENPQTFCIN